MDEAGNTKDDLRLPNDDELASAVSKKLVFRASY